MSKLNAIKRENQNKAVITNIDKEAKEVLNENNIITSNGRVGRPKRENQELNRRERIMVYLSKRNKTALKNRLDIINSESVIPITMSNFFVKALEAYLQGKKLELD